MKPIRKVMNFKVKRTKNVEFRLKTSLRKNILHCLTKKEVISK
jgi:hypothetical protein